MNDQRSALAPARRHAGPGVGGGSDTKLKPSCRNMGAYITAPVAWPPDTTPPRRPSWMMSTGWRVYMNNTGDHEPDAAFVHTSELSHHRDEGLPGIRTAVERLHFKLTGLESEARLGGISPARESYVGLVSPACAPSQSASACLSACRTRSGRQGRSCQGGAADARERRDSRRAVAHHFEKGRRRGGE